MESNRLICSAFQDTKNLGFCVEQPLPHPLLCSQHRSPLWMAAPFLILELNIANTINVLFAQFPPKDSQILLKMRG